MTTLDPAVDTAWKPLAIGAGGLLTSIDIASDGTMVARTDTHGAYIWGGDSWDQLVTAQSMPADLVRGGGLYEIRIAPSDSNLLYMMYWGDVYKSVDQGNTWSLTNFQHVEQHPEGLRRGDGQKMAVDPNNSQVVCAGTDAAGLFVTRDGGTTWQQVANVPRGAAAPDGSQPYVTGIVFDPSSGTTNGMTNTIYAASHGSGVYKSTDAGATWTVVPGSPRYVEYAAIDPHGNYYAVGVEGTDAQGLWKLTDGAWAQLRTGGALHAVAVDPFDSQHIIVTNGGGSLLESKDGGATWDGNWYTALESSNDIPWLENSGLYMSSGGIAFDPLIQNKLWQPAGVGVWHTTVEDVTPTVPVVWNSQSVGIEQLVANEVLAPPGGDPIVASWDRAFFKSTNPDAFPTHYSGGEFSMGWSVDYASSDPSFIVGISDWWGVEQSGYSTDGGETWHTFAALPSSALNTIGGTIAASTPQNIIWAPANGGVPAYTLDGGHTWTNIDLPGTDDWGSFHWAHYLNKTTVTADRALSNTFYLYDVGSGVYSTADGGATWTQVFTGALTPYSGFNAKIEAVPGSPGELFFTAGPQGDPTTPDDYATFMHSKDGGHTWQAVPNVVEVSTFGYGAPATPGGPMSVFIVGIVNGEYGIWQSSDNAGSWTQIGKTPMGSLDGIRTIAGDPDVYGRVYVGFGGSSYAYLSGPGAGDWQAGPGTGNQQTGDSTPPSLTITAGDGSLTAGESTEVTFKFSEAVTGFDATDVTPTNGTLSGLIKVDAQTYTGVFTPGANMTGDASVRVLAGSYTDAAGNLGKGGQTTVKIDTLSGWVGTDAADFRFGSDRANHMDGGDGDDTLYGGSGPDTLIGGRGNDWLVGLLGDDRLHGGEGDDRLLGDGGNDVLWGGSGADLIATGSGRDIVVVKPGDGADIVTDFDVLSDRIDLSGFGLSFEQIRSSAAEIGNSSIIYMGGGASLHLVNVSLHALSESMFIL